MLNATAASALYLKIGFWTFRRTPRVTMNAYPALLRCQSKPICLVNLERQYYLEAVAGILNRGPHQDDHDVRASGIEGSRKAL